MRILYHHRTQGEEPESVHIASIVAALRKLGHTVDIVGPVKISEKREVAKQTSLGRIKQRLPQFALELAQMVYNLRSLSMLVKQLRRERYDFIYERYALYNVAGLMAARMFNLPIVLEVNTPYAQAWGKYYGLKLVRLARAVERYTFRRVDRIITVTEVQRGLLEQEGVFPERIAVCHNAVEPSDFDPNDPAGAQLRRELGLRPLVVGFVGTMNRWQGVKGFAEVIRLVAAERKDVSFLFVGDGEGRAGLEAELQKAGLQGEAVFVGRKPHATIPRYVAAMDIGVLLDSNAYGSPMKVFEYWAMGKAVIAPSVGPVLEILRDGETGLLIAPGDAQAMARHILALAANPAERLRLGDVGRKHVLATHTWLQNAEKIVDAYSASRAAPPAARASEAAE
jgi:glycosyltransferase involved in cell wall biosynthesis